MPIDAAKFNALLDDEEVSGARASALNAPSLAPQDMGRAQKYARAGGLPVLAVANDLEFHDRKAALDEVEDTARQSPAMAQWLSRPENVAVSKGDLPLLSKLAQAIAYPIYSKGVRDVGATLGASTEAAAAGTHRSLADFVDEAFADDGSGGIIPRAVLAPLTAGIGATEALFGMNPASTAIRSEAQEQGDRAAEIGWGARQRMAIAQGHYGDNTPMYHLLGLTGSLPLMGAGLGVTALTRNPYAGASVMGVGTAGQQYSQAVDEGATRGEAALSGGVQGAIEVGTEAFMHGVALFGLKPFVADLEKRFGKAAVTTFLKKASATPVRRVALAGGAEVTTEVPTTIAQMASDEAILDKDYSLGDYVRATRDTAIQSLALGGGAYAATRPLRAAAERDKARVESAYLDNVIGSSLASKTREADPLAYEALLQGVNPEATVYVPQDALAALYQSENDARAAVADLTGEPTAWDEATATGGEVAIPLSKYATHLAEQHATLGPKARMEPGAEVHADTQLPTPDEIKADRDKFFAEAQKDSERGAGAEGEVYDAFYGQMLPHYGDVGAAQVAATMQAFYRTMAAKVGTDPLTLFNRFRINSGGPEQLARGKRRDVDIGIDPVLDAVLNGREFKDGEIYGGGILQAIIKSGGIRPDSVGAPDLAASGVQRPGFFSDAGMTVEAMAESLADGGWRGAFTQLDEFGRPDYRELLDLVRQELMGSPVYATDHDMRTQVSIDKREAFNRDVAAVAAAFREHAQRTGVDPATLTRAEQRKIAEGAFGELEQPAYHGTHARGIERFTLQKIGTGEGAQVYGWGLYFASRRGVAEWYRETVTQKHAQPSITLYEPGTSQLMTMELGTGEFGAWLANQGPDIPPELEDDQDAQEQYREDILEAAVDIENEIETTGKVPVPGWVDHQQRLGRFSEDRAPYYTHFIKILRSSAAKVKSLADQPFTYGDPAEGLRASADDLQGLFVDSDEFGDRNDLEVEDAAMYLVQVLREPDPDAAIDALRMHGSPKPESPEMRSLVREMLAQARAWNVKYAPMVGQLYKVDVPEDNELLDYDARMADQPPAVLDALADAGMVLEPTDAEAQERAQEMLDADAADWADENDGDPVDFSNNADWDDYLQRAKDQMTSGREVLDSDMTGKEFYLQLMKEEGWVPHLFDGKGQYQQAASEALLAMGIKGLRYLDGSSRGADRTSHNYVIWDEDAISEPEALYQSAEGMAQQAMPTFFSQLITSIESAKQERAPGAQWLGWLMNLPKLSKEEVEYYDLPRWLQGQKSVTKQALLDYLRANELTVTETTKGGKGPEVDLRNLPFTVEPGNLIRGDAGSAPVFYVNGPHGRMSFYPNADEAERAAYDYSVGYLRNQGQALTEIPSGYMVARITAEDLDAIGLDESDGVGGWGLFEDRGADQNPRDKGELISSVGVAGLTYAEAVRGAAQEAQEVIGQGGAEQMGFQSPSAPYANMTLPGGSGYKVMLLKLPVSQQAPESARDVMIRERVEMLRGLAADARAEGDEAAAALQDEAIANLLARNPQTTATKAREDFTGGHWQEPNVVAHVRFDERTDADGKRVLFVQELQSDWHQKGRKQGYQGVLNAQYPARDVMAADVGWQVRPATDVERRSFGLDDAAPTAVHVTYGDGSTSLYSADDIESALRKEWGIKQTMRFYNGKGSMPDAEWAALSANVAALEKDDSNGSAVPDAPFKTTWPELVMKRMLRYAAENGFDRVAWPTLEQVPQIEQWGVTLADIKSNPGDAKRFGAILDRYATEVPRIAKRLAKQMGGRLVESHLQLPGSLAQAPTMRPFDDGEYEVFSGAEEFPDGGAPLVASGPNTTVLINGERVPVLVSVDYAGVRFIDEANGEEWFASWPDGIQVDIAAADDSARKAQDAIDLLWSDAGSFIWKAEQITGDAGAKLSPAPADGTAQPAIEITPTMREAILGGLPLFQRQGGKKGPRGQVLGRDDKSIVGQSPDAEGVREFNITLFEGKDLSTVLHESAHAFLEIFADLAEDANASEQLRKDFASTLKWLGVTERGQIGRDQHEQFARGFEAYAREGKAPSRSLRRAFAQFKTFLLRIYQVATQLDVRLTDEVRAVFDRMLASEAEIAEATQAQSLSPLLTDFVALGWTPEQAEAYQVAVAEAQADAEHRLAAELLRAHQRADLAWWREERRRVRAEVEAETRALPVYRALRWLRNGKMPDGSDVPRAFKLSKADLLDDYGQSFLKRLRGTYAVEGGVRADEAAALLGYSSGRELVDAIVNAPPLREVIDADTDRIMAERYPDPMTDGSLADRAMHAVHSGKAADLMLLEVQALERGQRRGPTQMAIMREAVSRILASKVARKVTPQSYRAAEAKAGREALEAAAKGDMATALDARRRQLLNHLLFAEATRIRTEVEKAHRYLAKFTKTKARAKLGKLRGDYLEQIDGLLERFDFRTLSGKAADRRARLRDWIQSKAADDIHVDLPEQLVDDAFSVPFRDLTVEQVRQLRDAVKHIHHLATLKGKLLLKGQVLDQQAIDNEVAESVRDHSVALPDVAGEPSRGAWWAEQWAWARATMGAATDMARRLDGYRDLGPVWRHTVGVIRDAINNQVNPALQAAAKTVAALYLDNYSKAELRQFGQARKVPGVQGLWSKDRILSLALNWGNEGNREAVLTQSKKRLSPEEVGLLLGTLSERDWTFVQGVWKAIDAYWPDIAESQRRRKGLAPEKVPAAPFGVVTSDGKTLTIPGGYYPLKYEGGTRKMREEADEFYDAIRTGRFAKASTKDGHTIERVGSGGRAVRLDLGVIDSHLRDVIRDLYLGDAVNYTHQVLHGAEFSRAVEDTGHVETIKGLDIWLRDVATGEIGLRDGAQKTGRFFRQNFTAAVLTWKFVSAALQITGLLQSSVVLGKAPMLAGLQRYVRRPLAMTRYATGASPFMASRVKAHVEAVQEVLDARSGRIKQAHSAMIRYGYWMIGRVQQIVDVSTWLAAEAKGLEDFGGDIEKARLYADDVVSRAQGSGEFMDKTALQRGTFGDNVRQSEWIRASTMLQGYMITKHNAIVGRTAKAKQGMDGISGRSVWEGMKWAGDMANLLVVEAIVVALIRGALPDDEDDDGAADDWLAFMGAEAVSNLFGGLPGLSQIVPSLRGYESRGAFGQAIYDVGKLVEQTHQGKLDKALVKASVRVAGDATGIPSGQINKTIDAIAAEQDGKDVSILDYLRGPPKK